MKQFPAPTRIMYTLTFLIKKTRDPETGLYEAICRELRTVSCGTTVEQALNNIREACEMELDTFSDSSTETIKYLESHGIRVLKDGDALRERDRFIQTMEMDFEMLATPEHFTRELALT